MYTVKFSMYNKPDTNLTYTQAKNMLEAFIEFFEKLGGHNTDKMIEQVREDFTEESMGYSYTTIDGTRNITITKEDM